MGLGLNIGNSEGGDFLPIIKFDARAGRWSRIDRSQDASGIWGSDAVDITASFSAAFDVADCEVGWLKFYEGVSKVLVPMGEPLPPQTSPDHKQGFSMTVKLSADCGGDLREFSSSAKVVCAAMDALVDKGEASPEYKEAKIPIIGCASSNAVVTKTPGGTTTNYAPVFEITGWITRDQFGTQPEPAAVEQPAAVVPPSPPPPAGAVAASQF